MRLDYPGTVFAFANTFANMAGVIGPQTINVLVEDPTEHGDWFWLFMLSAFIFFASGIIFCAYATNEPQNYCGPYTGMCTIGNLKSATRKLKPDKSISQAQLTLGKEVQEVFKMEAYSRVLSQPMPKADNCWPQLGERESRLI